MAIRMLQVERDAALVAVQVDAVEAVPGAAEAIGAGRRLDPDDVGAPIRQVADAGWAGAGEGEVEHADAGQRQPVRRLWRLTMRQFRVDRAFGHGTLLRRLRGE